MKTNILLGLLTTATAALAAAVDRGDESAGLSEVNTAPPAVKLHTIYLTTLTTIAAASLTTKTSTSAPSATSSFSSLVVETAIVRETIWSDPTSKAWTTLGTTTQLPPTPSTSTTYSTFKLVAEDVTFTTTTLITALYFLFGGGTPSISIGFLIGFLTSGRDAAASDFERSSVQYYHHVSPPSQRRATTIAPDKHPLGHSSSVDVERERGACPSRAFRSGNDVDHICNSDHSADLDSRPDSEQYIMCENSAGEPMPGMQLTHLGGCTVVTSTLSDGNSTTFLTSAPDPLPTTTTTTTPRSAGAAIPTPPSLGATSAGPGPGPGPGPGATPAPFTSSASAVPPPAADAPGPARGVRPVVVAHPGVLRPRGRPRIHLF
ncbi:hypothetical protein VPNG_03301 [Cytospora leucostoma]|uniref:Uncharacterized protein n=1 Tax=Cytospora leucostoma TaxID=1230097 RepID=A0A423XFI3_9PEZI|nr:hypothetical protein VPNG_03301 [Cytospora leucostoma]